jgi:hypothetical protein
MTASDGVGVHVYFSDKSYGVAALQRLDDLAQVLAADKDAKRGK